MLTNVAADVSVVLRASSDPYDVAVDDHECLSQLGVGNFGQQSRKGVLCFFDGGGPYA